MLTSKRFKAYSAWLRLTGLEDSNAARYDFAKFLGLFCNAHWQGVDSTEAAAKIAWLTGPHAETLYKAWKIKNEAEL